MFEYTDNLESYAKQVSEKVTRCVIHTPYFVEFVDKWCSHNVNSSVSAKLRSIYSCGACCEKSPCRTSN